MQKTYAVAIVAALAIATPSYARAAENTQIQIPGGNVCGRVAAPSSYILQLYLAPEHDNVIYARSAREEVRSTVNVDGTYCFRGLKNGVYTVYAFNDGVQRYSGSVTPIEGKTIRLDLFAQPGVEDIAPAGTQNTYKPR